MLTNALRVLIYELFLETFYLKNNKIINVVENIYIFFMKMVSKLSYYCLLTIALRAFVKITHSLNMIN